MLNDVCFYVLCKTNTMCDHSLKLMVHDHYFHHINFYNTCSGESVKFYPCYFRILMFLDDKISGD